MTIYITLNNEQKTNKFSASDFGHEAEVFPTGKHFLFRTAEFQMDADRISIYCSRISTDDGT